MDAEISIRGIAETQKAIAEFSTKLSDRVIRLSLRSGANAFKSKLAPNIPVKSGRLKRSVTVKNSRRDTPRKNKKIGVYVNFRTKGGRNDPRSAIYGGWVERGYNAGSRKLSTRDAVRQGITTDAQDLRRRALTGRKITYRSTGTRRVEGQRFVEKTFNANREAIRRLIITNIEQAGTKLINEIRGRR